MYELYFLWQYLDNKTLLNAVHVDHHNSKTIKGVLLNRCPLTLWTGQVLISGGYLGALQQLGSSLPFDSWSYTLASKHGHLDILKHVCLVRGPAWNQLQCVQYASRYGHTNILEYLLQSGCRLVLNVQTSRTVCENGHLDALLFLIESGCPLDYYCCNWAAMRGHVEILKCLRDHGCPWNTYTCASAAYSGNLNVLKWLRSQDPPCPWDRSTTNYAIINGHDDILKWTQAQTPKCDVDTKLISKLGLKDKLRRLKLYITSSETERKLL
jgi:hypothetical protein